RTNLRLIQAGFFSLTVGWDQPSSAVQGYRLTYGLRGENIISQPADQLLFLSVPSDSTSATLQSLQPDTEYVINLYPLFPRNSATPSTLNAVQQLSVETQSEGSVVLRWAAVNGARAYRVVWGPFTGQRRRRHSQTHLFHTLSRLQPDIEYINVGEVVPLSARTNPHGGSVSGFRIVDVTSQRIRLAWSTSSRATGYKITWSSSNEETSRIVPADVSSFTIDGLLSDSAYSVQVSALSGSREGSPVSLNIRTESDQSVVGTVTSLQVQEAQGEDVRITWVGVQGATAYRVTWRRTDGGEERSRLVAGDVTSVDLDRLEPGAQYEVQVMALVQNREGSPVSVRITTRKGEGLSVSLPASSSSYLVSGLRLGRRYRFSVQPAFERGLGTESAVDEHTGNRTLSSHLCQVHKHRLQ
uniref:Fibronectin type-III domain-containing protein n=1 Tax=Cynoglossus semilaevis TaxID=244447 RepID=A0A3P8UTM7_CYNSE